MGTFQQRTRGGFRSEGPRRVPERRQYARTGGASWAGRGERRRQREPEFDRSVQYATAEIDHMIRAPWNYKLDRDAVASLKARRDEAIIERAEYIRRGRHA